MKSKQTEFQFRGRGGKRPGAGRPRSGRKKVPHRRRVRFTARNPLHVTVRVRDDMPRLRRRKMMRVLARAFVRGCLKDEFRICQFSVQGNHIHLICEAAGAAALARGIQGWKVRVARGINKLLGRKGPVFDDRYDVQVLDSPARVRAALCYVMHNARKHGTFIGKGWADGCSSARYFDGWRRTPRLPPCAPDAPCPVAPATTWLLTTGWRRRGLIDPDEVPAGAAAMHTQA